VKRVHNLIDGDSIMEGYIEAYDPVYIFIASCQFVQRHDNQVFLYTVSFQEIIIGAMVLPLVLFRHTYATSKAKCA